MAPNIDFSKVHNEIFHKLADKYDRTSMRKAYEPEFIAVAALLALDIMECNINSTHMNLIVNSADSAFIGTLRINEIEGYDYATAAESFVREYMQGIKNGIEHQMGTTVESTITQDKNNPAILTAEKNLILEKATRQLTSLAQEQEGVTQWQLILGLQQDIADIRKILASATPEMQKQAGEEINAILTNPCFIPGSKRPIREKSIVPPLTEAQEASTRFRQDVSFICGNRNCWINPKDGAVHMPTLNHREFEQLQRQLELVGIDVIGLQDGILKIDESHSGQAATAAARIREDMEKARDDVVNLKLTASLLPASEQDGGTSELAKSVKRRFR